MTARDIIASAVSGALFPSKRSLAKADQAIADLHAAGYRLIGPEQSAAMNRLLARAEAWKLNADSARISVRLGDLRSLQGGDK